MKIKDITEEDKAYVSVWLYYTPVGDVRIESVEWSDGREFRVEDQQGPRRTGDRHIREIYRVRIRGKWKLLFYQDPEFFVLKKK